MELVKPRSREEVIVTVVDVPGATGTRDAPDESRNGTTATLLTAVATTVFDASALVAPMTPVTRSATPAAVATTRGLTVRGNGVGMGFLQS